jgi:hypothetical protein
MHFFQKNKNDKISKKLYFFKYKCLLIYKSIILPHFDFCASVLYLMDKTKIVLQKLQNRGMRIILFCSTLSEFENFLLCERILINVTTCQNETSS